MIPAGRQNCTCRQQHHQHVARPQPARTRRCYVVPSIETISILGLPVLLTRHFQRRPSPKPPATARFSPYTLENGYWNNNRNRHKFMDYVLANYAGNDLDKLHHLPYSTVVKLGGGGLTSRLFANNMALTIKVHFPEHAWTPWRFTTAGWWNLVAPLVSIDPLAQISALQWMEEQFGAPIHDKTPQDFQALRSSLNSSQRRVIEILGGLNTIIKLVRPDSLVSNSPKGLRMLAKTSQGYAFWRSPLNRRQYLDKLKDELNLRDYSGFYDANFVLLSQARATALTGLYGSVFIAIMSEYPEYAWIPWKFLKTPLWWTQLSKLFAVHDPVAVATVQLLVEFLQMAHGTDLEVPFDSKYYSFIKNLGGIPFILKNLRTMRDNGRTQTSESSVDFPRFSVKHWDIQANRATFMNQMKDLLGGELDSLHHLVPMHFVTHWGHTLLRKHTIPGLLTETWPKHPWKLWHFYVAPKRYWNTLAASLRANSAEAVALVKSFLLEEVANSKGIFSMDDWASISRKQISHRNFRILKHLGGLNFVLTRVFPEHKWDLDTKKRHGNITTVQQGKLGSGVAQLLPTEDVNSAN